MIRLKACSCIFGFGIDLPEARKDAGGGPRVVASSSYSQWSGQNSTFMRHCNQTCVRKKRQCSRQSQWQHHPSSQPMQAAFGSCSWSDQRCSDPSPTVFAVPLSKIHLLKSLVASFSEPPRCLYAFARES